MVVDCYWWCCCCCYWLICLDYCKVAKLEGLALIAVGVAATCLLLDEGARKVMMIMMMQLRYTLFSVRYYCCCSLALIVLVCGVCVQVNSSVSDWRMRERTSGQRLEIASG